MSRTPAINSKGPPEERRELRNRPDHRAVYFSSGCEAVTLAAPQSRRLRRTLIHEEFTTLSSFPAPCSKSTSRAENVSGTGLRSAVNTLIRQRIEQRLGLGVHIFVMALLKPGCAVHTAPPRPLPMRRSPRHHGPWLHSVAAQSLRRRRKLAIRALLAVGE
jgi:hypothetical protein